MHQNMKSSEIQNIPNVQKINEMIDTAIQNELTYQKDLIKNTAWDFLENKAPELILTKIIEDYNENLNETAELTDNDITNYLDDIITQYENEHGSLRVIE